MPHPLFSRVLARTRYVFTRHQSRALILFYHGVTNAVSDPWRLHMPPPRFAEQLEVLRRYGKVLRLDALVHGLQTDRLPRRSVAVTFDDGYANNLTEALPLLEKYEIPATIFVTTDYLGSAREFWSDELERLLLHPGRLPAQLQLRLNGHCLDWNLADAAVYQRTDFERHRRWNAWEPGEPSVRHRLYRELYRTLQPLPQPVQQRVLQDLRAQVTEHEAARPLNRFLTPAEVLQLAQSELIEIGSHTVSHPLLPQLAAAQQEREIHESRLTLEEIIGQPVTSLAYPYGRYAAETPGIARAAGMQCACAAEGFVAQAKTDLFRLPRCPVQDWDGAKFERLLDWWFRH